MIEIRKLTPLFFLTLLIACGAENKPQDNEARVANAAPVANAGSDQTINEKTLVTLSAVGSDSDGSIVSYQWQQTTGTSVSLSNADQAVATFIAPEVSSNEILTFRFTVTDDKGASSSDNTHINIMDVANMAPTANAGSEQTVNELSSVTLNGTGSLDSDGSIAQHLWQQISGSNVVLSDPTNASPTFTAPATTQNETLVFSLTVTDNQGAQNSDTVSVHVNDLVITHWYKDLDGDGFGDLASEFIGDDPGEPYVSNATDCDDNAAAIHPGASEISNGLDDNCDSQVDNVIETAILAWAMDNTTDWVITGSGTLVSEAHANCFNGACFGFTSQDAGIVSVQSPPIDSSNYTSIAVIMSYTAQLTHNSRYFRVLVSMDGGNSWAETHSINGDDALSAAAHRMDLTSQANDNANLKIKFELEGNSAAVHLDDVKVVGLP